MIRPSPAVNATVLFLVCILSLGVYYCYDIPGALNTKIREWMDTPYELHQYHLNLLYTVYSVPNLVLPLIGGYMLDHIGSDLLLLVMLLGITLGQGLFAFGLEIKAYWLMLMGRLLFGIGGETIEVIQTTITTEWFKNWNLSFALSLNLTIARFGSALNDVLSPKLEKSIGVVKTVWLGICAPIVSLFAGLCMLYFTRKYPDAGDQKSLLVMSPYEDEEREEAPLLQYEAVSEEKRTEHIWKHLTQFDNKFWLLCFVCVTYYGSVVPFVHIASDFLQSKYYKDDIETAGAVMSIPDFVSAVGSPVCALFLDWWKMHSKKMPVIIFGEESEVSRRFEMERSLNDDVGRYLLPFAGVIVLVSHLMFAFTEISPIILLVLIGLGYSVFGAVIWPLASFIVPAKKFGTAYGFLTIALNASLSLFPLLIAKIRVGSSDFMPVILFFASMASIGTLLSLWLCLLCFREVKHK